MSGDASHMVRHLLATGWVLASGPPPAPPRPVPSRHPVPDDAPTIMPVVLNAWSPRLAAYAMNGKTFLRPDKAGRPPIPSFLHAHKGSQWHGKEDCPCPVEAAVAEWLSSHGYVAYYAYQRPAAWKVGDRETIGTLRKIAVGDIFRGHKITYEGRPRYYPPQGLWQARDNVRESGGGRGQDTLYYDLGGSRALFTVPYIKPEINLPREEGDGGW